MLRVRSTALARCSDELMVHYFGEVVQEEVWRMTTRIGH